MGLRDYWFFDTLLNFVGIPKKVVEPKIDLLEAGDLAECREFGKFWNLIKIISVSASGSDCIYCYLIVDAKPITTVSFHEGNLKFLSSKFKKYVPNKRNHRGSGS